MGIQFGGMTNIFVMKRAVREKISGMDIYVTVYFPNGLLHMEKSWRYP